MICDLKDISRIIRENYNEELANELDGLIPEHMDEEFYRIKNKLEDLEFEYSEAEDTIATLENKIDILEEKIDELEDKQK